MTLLTDLCSLLRELDPPQETHAASLAAARRRLGADRLPQVADSSWPGARARGPRRLLAYAGSGATLDVDLVPMGGRLDIAGALAAPPGFELELWHPEGTVGELGPGGRFAVRDVPAGPISFVLRSAGSRPLATDWVRV
ncbi:hypothetical protein [Allokutzneria oryzae]|uniref:Anti-sigma factor n=1 Tax=Allokutzneria oryzae TaxID=1378989 RepID=A0ABV5ZYW0_9PSEU